MRPIKFRAWDKEKNKMISHIESISFDFQWVPAYMKSVYDLNVINWQNSGDYERLAFQVELMQFTWLLDKNWKEIYEGDIIKKWNQIFELKFGICDQWTSPEPPAFQIWFYYEEKWWPWITDFWHQYPYEVIWNIYENPELLTNTYGK